MPISVACNACGKRLRVPDDRVGKKAKCPGCGATFTVTADGAPAAPAPAFIPGPSKPKASSPRFEISGGMIALIVITALVGIIIAVVYYGPIRAKQQWDVAQPKAEADVTDVVQRGLESYLSNAGMDLNKPNVQPSVREVIFAVLPVQFSMPKVVQFKAVTTQGEATGTYDLTTGEVEGTVEVGGMSFAGMSGAIRHGAVTFKVTGRKKDGQLSAEVDGKNAVVVYPKKEDR